MPRKAKRQKQIRRSAAPKKKPLRPNLLTRRALAHVLGVHMQTVTKWEQDGMPIAERGSKGRPSLYRELDVRAWLQRREEAAKAPGAVDLTIERARRERAQAVLAEQAFKIRQRDLLPRDEVEKVWASEVQAVRTKLLAWPLALADQLYRVSATDGLAGLERVLTAAVHNVLRELADPDRPIVLPAEPTADDPEDPARVA